MTVTALPHGVFQIDTGFHREAFDAAYLIADGGRGAYVDTGTQHSVPRLLAALDAAGLTPAQVDWLIVTHVHLDHAGGAGLLLRSLPHAKLVVHPRGAPHMIDPTALYEGARAVYGDAEMARQYGTLVPVPAERVLATHDGMTLALGGRELRFVDTPGHARHHHCIWEPLSRGWFTGDTFGLSYRLFDGPAGPFLMPTTTPVQFEPGPLRASIERLLAAEPACLYLTHYGRIDGPARAAAGLLSQLDAIVAAARTLPPGDGRHAALREAVERITLDALAAHGSTVPPDEAREWLALDIELNAQGLGVWLGREARSAR